METPDFEKMATASLDEIKRTGGLLTYDWLKDQLRIAWNARGAADIVKLEAELGVTASGPYVKNLDRALRSLDR